MSTISKAKTQTRKTPTAFPQVLGTAAAKAGGGVKTIQQFADVMSALMADLLTGAVQPNTANAVCNAGGKLLKAVDLQVRHDAVASRRFLKA